MFKKAVKISAALCIAALILAALQRLVTPKYTPGNMAEGGLIEAYYDTEKDHDVIFLGDCEVYENFSPEVIERETGLKCYIRGSAQQLIWQSYYLLEDTLRYETPKAVVFNVLSMKYNEPQNEAYNRMTLEGMEWSAAKVASINASMTDDESFVTYLFPLLRYHDRIRELSGSDFEYFFSSPKLTKDGAYLREGVLPADNVPVGKPLESYEFGDTAWEYMEKMRLLCEEKGIKLILIKAPVTYPYWYDEWNRSIADYADNHGLSYINFLSRLKSTGLSFDTDTYDGGLHLNKTGAEKLSEYFAPILKELVADGSNAVIDRLNGHVVGNEIVTEAPTLYYEAVGDDVLNTDGAGDVRPVAGSEADSVSQKGAADAESADGGRQEVGSGADSASQKAPADNDKGSQPDSDTPYGFVFTYKGINLYPGMKWDEAASADLGEPISYFEAKSCVFEGIDRMYTYPGFEVDTSPDGTGGDSVTTVYLLDDSVTTPEGAYIGCTKSLVEKLYGEYFGPEENSKSYERGGTELKFVLKDETVVSICYSLGDTAP